MKNLSIIHILLFLLFLLVYQFAGAQDYLVTSRGDSLTGSVKPLFYGPEKKVQITTAGRNKTSYSIFEVKSYSKDGEIFHPVKGESGYVFMKLIKPGYLSLYAYQQDQNQMRFDGLFLLKRDGKSLVVPNLGFKKYIAKFLDDCAEVTERIKEGQLSKKDLNSIVDNYNACIQNRTADHTKFIVEQKVETTHLTAWDSLETHIQAKEFSGKSDALEMIAEIRKKISHDEKIPNFLLEGLKNSLQETGLSAELEQAIDQRPN